LIGLLLLCSWGLKNNIDCIAASFIRKPSDVLEIRSFCEQKIKELSLSNATVPLIISKIESTEGLENFHDILKVSDAIMVARGDLGVEIPLETLTAVQKEIVSQCNRACKPVIVATQMLESMQKNPRPTRAEVTDVANAVLDGADCVMLSGESAKGKYSIDSVAMQRKVVQETEMILQKKSLHLIDDFHTLSHLPNNQYGDHTKDLVSQIRSSNSSGILLLFEDEQMNVEIAKLLSKSKLFIPIFLPVGSYKTARLLSLYQSLYPLVNSTPNPTQENFCKQMQERFGKETFAKIKKNMTIFNEKSI
jgi:pyruvate kinase